MFKQRVVLLSADTWELTKEDGKILNGCTIFYYPNENFDKIINDSTSSGMKPCKETMPYEFIERVNKNGGCPCIVELRQVMRNRNGKQFLAIEGLDFIEGNVIEYILKNNKKS